MLCAQKYLKKPDNERFFICLQTKLYGNDDWQGKSKECYEELKIESDLQGKIA